MISTLRITIIELIEEFTKWFLTRADDHRIYIQAHWLILDHEVQSIVIDHSVINTIDHIHAAATQCSSVRPPRCLTETTAHGRALALNEIHLTVGACHLRLNTRDAARG